MKYFNNALISILFNDELIISLFLFLLISKIFIKTNFLILALIFGSIKIFINIVMIDSVLLKNSVELLYLIIYLRLIKSSYLQGILFSLFNRLIIEIKILSKPFTKNLCL